MKASTFTSRLLAVALALAPAACHQSPAVAQDKDAAADQAAPTPPGAPPEAPKPPPPPGGRKAKTAPARNLPGAAGGSYGSGGSYGGQSRGTLDILPPTAWRGYSSSGDAAPVIATAPMEAAVQAEWKEDLSVMDRLLRGSVVDNDGDNPMGLKLGGFGRVSPMYVEGAGVILSSGVMWPLAPGANKEPAGDAPRERTSKWARARREVRGEPPTDGPREARRPPYDAARVDALAHSILSVLPEASNFRHLKPGESVFVTVSGFNEDGAPVRLTMKATKADIDEAAKGGIDAETFKQRVARRVG